MIEAMIPEEYREGRVEDPDEYSSIRDAAITYAHVPPPTDADVAQFREAYADINSIADVSSGTKPIQHALIFWSDSLYTAEQLRAIVPDIIPSYHNFDGTEATTFLTRRYRNAWFIPAREFSVTVYVVNTKDRPLKKPSEAERAQLKVDTCDFYPPSLDGSEVPTDILRLWWR